MPKFIRTMKDYVMRILVITFKFQRFIVKTVCIHDTIDDKPMIMRTIMIKFIYIREYVFDKFRENDTYANKIYS